MYDIELPLFVEITKKKKFYLNLNQYRNAHYHTLNKAKGLFSGHVKPLIGHLPSLQRVGILYTLYVPDERDRDVGNVCSIVDKFFCDCLVENNILIDDNFRILPDVGYTFGGISKPGKVIASIVPLKPL